MINELGRNPNNVFRLVRKITQTKDVIGGRYMRGNNGTFHLYDERAKHRNAHMSNILSEENEWDQIVAVDTVDGPSVRVRRENKMGYSST